MSTVSVVRGRRSLKVERRPLLVLGLVIVGLMAGWFRVIDDGEHALAITAAGVFTLLCVVLFVWAVASAVRGAPAVELRDGAFYYRGHFRTVRLIPVAGSSVVAAVRLWGVLGPAQERLLLGQDGRAVRAAFSELSWDLEQLDALFQQGGLTITRADDPLSPAELAARYPDALRWFERHGEKGGLILALVGIFVLMLCASLIQILT